MFSLILFPQTKVHLLLVDIYDNVVVAYEILHTMNSMKGKKSFMALKLDMSKAYDWVEWNFLERVIRRMGFRSIWIHLI